MKYFVKSVRIKNDWLDHYLKTTNNTGIMNDGWKSVNTKKAFLADVKRALLLSRYINDRCFEHSIADKIDRSAWQQPKGLTRV